MRRLDARPMRRVIMDTEADFHRRSPNCCGRISSHCRLGLSHAPRRNWVYLMHRGGIGRRI